MADASSDDIHTLELFVASQYINCSILCLVAYEYAITFGREVRCIWMRKLSATSLLLLSIRWTMVLSQVLVWIPFLSSRTTCAVYYVLRELLLFSTYAQIALFSGLRVCALWNGSPYRYLHLFCILMLGFVPIWTNVFRWSRTTISWTGAPYYTCSVPADLPLNVVNAMVVFTRTCAIAVDAMVLVLTWIRTFQHWRQSRQVHNASSVATLLLRDGTLYFLALLAMNIAQVITFSEANETWGNFANLFLQNTPPILVQRFMLNLREFNSAESAEGNSDFEHFSRFSVSFRVPSGFMGNIGQPLDHGQLPELCEDDGDIDNEWVSANMDMYGSERSPSSSTHSGAA